MGGPLPAFAGISLANEDNHTNQMPENRWIASIDTTQPENSLFRPMNSLFRGNRFPVFPCSQGSRPPRDSINTIPPRSIARLN